jgi:hypothetical protein
MTILHEPLRVQEQGRANWIVTRLAQLLRVPTEEETLRDPPEVPLVFASYRGWRLDVYVELAEEGVGNGAWSWVLILSRGDLRGYRLFTLEKLRRAAHHVHRFAEDPAYRRHWFR